MTEAFIRIVNMSISALWLILVVLIFRLVLKSAPKWTRLLLWGFVALRLVCPFSPESMFSLIPSGETVSPSIMMDRSPSIDSGIEVINNVINPLISRSFTPSPVQSANPLQVLLPVLSAVWLTGMAILIIHAALSCLRLYRRLGTAVLLSENIYQGEFIDAPFVFGILHPKIYLPVGLEERDVGYVVAHEQAHIRRFDHWWKPLGYLLLAVHWFNPLVWVAYVLLCRDIEFACDEKVVSGLDAQQRADYSQALLDCCAGGSVPSACPLAFGEVGVKGRIKSVLNYKKPAAWLIAAAVLVCLAVVVCFLTDPRPRDTSDTVSFLGADSTDRYITAEYSADLGHEVKSGTVRVEQWSNGECVSSAPVTLTEYVKDLSVLMSLSNDDGAYRGVNVQIDTGGYGGSLLTYFNFPEDSNVIGWSFTAWEQGDELAVAPDGELILASLVPDMGSGVHAYDCRTLLEEPERLKQAEYMVIVRASFSPQEIPLSDEAQVGQE